jgi:hypothetical protein
MANQYEDDEDDFDMEDEQPQAVDPGPANLRKALKRAEREKKDLAEQLASIQQDLRSRSVKEVLASKGVPDKVAKFIPGDISTPEQVNAWLTENADVFGFSTSDEAEAAPTEEVPSQNVMNTQRINAATHNANTPSRDQDVAAKLAGVKNKAELDMLVFGESSGRPRR